MHVLIVAWLGAVAVHQRWSTLKSLEVNVLFVQCNLLISSPGWPLEIRWSSSFRTPCSAPTQNFLYNIQASWKVIKLPQDPRTKQFPEPQSLLSSCICIKFDTVQCFFFNIFHRQTRNPDLFQMKKVMKSLRYFSNWKILSLMVNDLNFLEHFPLLFYLSKNSILEVSQVVHEYRNPRHIETI